MPMLKETMLKRLLLPIAAAGGGGSAPVQDTATGNPLVFFTDLARPLKSLLIPFSPQQEGSGDPSPENIRSILPWNGLKVFGGGKNLFNKDDPDVQLNKRVETGGTIISSQYGQAVTGFIPVKAGAKYIISNYINENYFSCFYSEKDITKPVGAIFGNNEYPKTAPNGAKYLIVTIGNTGIDGFQIEAGQTASAYTPFKPITDTDISFPSPVYGGYVDMVTGEVWATWFVHNFLWSDKWYGSELTNVERRAFKLPNGVIPHTMSYYNDHKSEIKCNIAPLLWTYTTDNTHYYVDKDGDYYRALVFLPIGTSEDTQIQVGGTLADPVLITTITPEQITALKGENTIWSDADGSMTATYLKKG